jgi:hypothetical protein
MTAIFFTDPPQRFNAISFQELITGHITFQVLFIESVAGFQRFCCWRAGRARDIFTHHQPPGGVLDQGQ